MYRALRMSMSTWLARHAALDGDVLRRVAVVRAWVAAFRADMLARRDDRVALRDAVAAAADHACARIPANVGIAAPARTRERSRARA